MAKSKKPAITTDEDEIDNEAVASSSSKADSKKEAASKVVSNPRVVEAIKAYDGAMSKVKSYLVTIARIVLNEDLTRAEVVASIMEARDIKKETAEPQASRIMSLAKDEDTLEQLETGEVDLKSVTAKKKAESTRVVSDEVKARNLDKKFASNLKQFVITVKEAGMSKDAALKAVRLALKNGGVE